MSATWDDRIDDVTEQARDERAARVEASRGGMPVAGEWRVDDKRGQGTAHIVDRVDVVAESHELFPDHWTLALARYTVVCGTPVGGASTHSVPALSDSPRCRSCVFAPVCEGCGMPCDPFDYAQHDGHGPDCPHGDPDCQLRVCDGVHADPTSHSVCETQAERDGRDAVEAAEAGRERWAEWHAEDGL